MDAGQGWQMAVRSPFFSSALQSERFHVLSVQLAELCCAVLRPSLVDLQPRMHFNHKHQVTNKTLPTPKNRHTLSGITK